MFDFLIRSSFDDRANGYARGEGICVMALKSVEDAIRDNDTIRAVIRGSGTNQDGNRIRAQSGIGMLICAFR